MAAQLDAELAKADAFLRGGAQANDFSFSGVENLERRLGGAPGDGAVDKEDIADGRETSSRDVSKGCVSIADDDAGLGTLKSALCKRDRFA